MQVSRFIDPEWLIEIEADAVVDVGGDAIYMRCSEPGKRAPSWAGSLSLNH